jgi:uncharacterized membrane protein YjfL (UPF0719 family)
MKKQGRTSNYIWWVIIGWVVMTIVFGGDLLPSFSNLINNTSNTSTITNVPTPYDNNQEPTINFKKFFNYILIGIVSILIYLYIYLNIKKKGKKMKEKKNGRN